MYKIVYIFVFTFTLGDSFGQNYTAQREQMVKAQLQGRNIKELNTLRAMAKVPRHKFVPAAVQSKAYHDGALPIGEGQTISQPYIVAFMTQELQLKPDHRVLEIGTGSGYQAAILSEIVDSVFTIEIVKKLGDAAKIRLGNLGYQNVVTKVGDGYHGWPAKAPFDGIIVTAGVDIIPQPLLDQLAEGGRMILPLGPSNNMLQLVLAVKKNGKVMVKNRMPVRFVPFTRDK